MQRVFEELQGRFDVDLETVHHFSSGVYAKEMHLPAGYMAVSHAHTYDHLSILSKGKAVVKTEDGETVYTAPACIEIKKNLHHGITALEDVTWFCIHATEETNPDKVDEVLIKQPSKEGE